jgi:hypothetical protein
MPKDIKPVKPGKFSIVSNMAADRGFTPYCSSKDWRYLIRINDPTFELFTLDELEAVGKQIQSMVKAARTRIASHQKQEGIII